MGKCIIIASMYEGEEPSFLKKEPGDLLICADAGFRKAEEYGLEPDLVMGDFDSSDQPSQSRIPVKVFPVKKDVTDTALCIQEGRRRGYREFRIGGGMGGRFDHTIANLQLLSDCAKRGEQAWMVDTQNRVTVLSPGEYTFQRMENRKLSLFAYTEQVSGIMLHGTEWELENAELVQQIPLGCSNWFRSEQITLQFREGLLMLAFCRD